MKKLLSSIAILTTLFAGCSMAPAKHIGNDDLLRSIQKSTVYIRVDDPEGSGAHEWCSGWVLKNTHTVVTAAHCEGPNPAVDFGDGVYHPFTISIKGDRSWKTSPDLMTLVTADSTIKWPLGLSVCAFPAYYGEPLVLYGAPLGIKGSMTFGLVGNPSKVDNDFDKNDGVTRPFIQWDGKGLEGNSGGAAVDLDNQCVMGVMDYGHLSSPQSGSDYGISFLTPASQLGELK
jgi:Trypsin-like peptidase domain